MRNLIIVCEGPTEQEFCKDLLQPALPNVNIFTPLVKRSNGGVVPWPSLRTQIIRHLHEGDAIVSMMIDYYGIKDDYKYPEWENAKLICNKVDRMQSLEAAMQADIPTDIVDRYIPHLQLHEFETLLFSDISAFQKWYEPTDLDMKKLQSIVKQFHNPEDINESRETAPSKRIEGSVIGYSKVVDGNTLALEIGLSKMLQMCPHFNSWFIQLQNIR